MTIHFAHILNKSIAGYTIYRDNNDYERFIQALQYYQYSNPPLGLAEFIRHKKTPSRCSIKGRTKLVDIICYCIMPTHFHLVLENLTSSGFSPYINTLLNSYTRYFNTRYQRKGPLWQSRTKQVPITTNEQLFHLTRYIHANPVKAGLVSHCEIWPFSSYLEYLDIDTPSKNQSLCSIKKYFDFSASEYAKLTNEYIHA